MHFSLFMGPEYWRLGLLHRAIWERHRSGHEVEDRNERGKH